ncbi:hypothetical protein PIROE2DRAFT_9759, partial [Piromyces sp. E2]
SDNGLCSIYEFIYSCRESKDAPFPELTSESAVNAVKLIKKIKEELSSDEIFQTETVFSTNYFEKNALFIKFWTFYGVKNMENYYISNLPGIKEGISGSALIGYNIGIDSNIGEDKKESAIEAVKIMTSKEFQKSQVLEGTIISGISSLYNDTEVCSKVMGCEIYNTIQPIAKPVNKIVDYIEYSKKFTTYFYDFLYGNKNNDTEESILKKIDDITRLYNVSVNSKETSIGLILDWIMVITGIIMIASTSFINYGEMSDFKCTFKNNLFSLGYSFITIPILCQLIINFPETNRISIWVNKYRKNCILTLIFIDVLLNGLSLVKPHGVENIIIDEGENFQMCKISIFVEWNFSETLNDIRFVLSFIYTNVISFSLYVILIFTVNNNYKSYFIAQECIIYIITISNYILIFGIKIILPQLYEKDEMNEIIKKVRVSKIFSSTNGTTTNGTCKTKISTASSNSSTNKSIYLKLLNLHYSTTMNETITYQPCDDSNPDASP